MTPEQRRTLVALLLQYDDIFARSMEELGEYRGEVGPARIDLVHDRPIYQPPRHHSEAEYVLMEAKCKELLQAYIIEDSRSSKYAMNSTMPAKRDANGQWTDRRFCQDARALNAATVPDLHRSPLPEELFQQIGDAQWLTKCDCRAAFLQIPLHPEHKERTSFWWRRRLMQYKRLVYGLRNATAHFQRVMDFHIRQHGLEHCVCCYVDDLLVYSRTFEEHVEHLRRVFEMLRSINIRLHPEKTLVGGDSVEFLGFMVSGRGMGPTEARVAAFLALEAPTSSSGVRTMLGMFSYYRALVHHFADITAPLNPLTSKNHVWRADSWGPEQQAALDELKRIYTQEGLVLRRAQPDRPLILHTDFSGVGISGVLGQLDDQGREYMCACISRSLNVHERKYGSSKGELLAVVWSIKTLHCYLHCRPFTLVTDHAPLLWLMTSQDNLSAQYARWVLCLQSYDFDVVHRPSRLHQNADTFSRSALPSAHDGTGARLDEEDDWQRPPPALVPYPGVEWPAHARPRATPLAPRACAQVTHVLASRYAAAPDMPTPATAMAFLAACAPATSCTPVLVVNAHHSTTAWQPRLRSMQLQLVTAATAPAGGLIPTHTEMADPAPDPAHASLLRATAQVRVERTALRTVQPLPALPLRLQQPGMDVLGLNTALVQHHLFPPALGGAGIAVLELPGALASGLLACLQVGFRVRRYVHLDCDPPALAVASALVPALGRAYDGLLAADAWDPAVVPPAASPADLVRWACSGPGAASMGLMDTSLPWLVVGSWAANPGWRAPHFLRLVGGLQQAARAAGAPPPAYLLEGPACLPAAAEAAGLPFGHPTTLDAAQTTASLHRVCSLYTNLANPAHLAFLLRRLPPTSEAALDCALPPGLQPAACGSVLPEPYAAIEAPGRPWRALPPADLQAPPPLLAGPDRRPCSPDAATLAALAGFESLPNHPSLLPLLRTSVPPPVYAAALASALSLHRAYVTPHDMQPLPPRLCTSSDPGRPLGGESAAADGALEAACFAVDAADLELAAALHVELHLTSLARELLQQRAPSAAVDEATHILACACDAQEAAGADGSHPDVWLDPETMALLRAPGPMSPDAARRAQRRAMSYRWTGAQLLRLMPDGSTRVCPPPELRLEIVRRTHAVAHLGVRRTLALVQLGYWWHGMRPSVQAVVRSCKLCDMCNTSGTARPVQLQPLPIRGMFYRWGIDLAGPLPPTKPHGFLYVMVCVEHFTKHAEFYPLRDKTAAETARGLLDLLTRFGAPAEVVTDRGTEFEGQFDALLQRCYVDHRLTSPSHPQSDGAAERLVKVVKSALRKHCAETGCSDAWDLQLPWLALAYRCSPQASTRHAPYTLLYGVPPVVPPAARERLAPDLAFDGTPDEQAYADTLVERAATLRRLAPAAAGNLLIAQHRDTLQYARIRSGRHQPPALQFLPGDYVYLKQLNPSNTLQLPVRDTVLRVESVGPMGVAVLLGRDGARVRRRVEQLAPCHLPDLDPIVDARLQRPAADLPCEVCGSPDKASAMLLCDGCGTGWHLGCLVPPLGCVPEGSWVCPECVKVQRAAPAGPLPPLPDPSPVLFPNAATRRRDDEAAALDGRRIMRRSTVGRGKAAREVVQTGVLRYRGGLARPHYFFAEWDGGSAEAMQLAAAKRLLVAETAPAAPLAPPRGGNAPPAALPAQRRSERQRPR